MTVLGEADALGETNVESFDIQASLQYDSLTDYLYQDISLTLYLNKVTCLLGQSGCGKSSLLKQLVGLHRGFYKSELTIQHSSAGILTAKEYQSNVAYMAQQDLLLPWLSVLDNVLLAYDLNRSFLAKKGQKNKDLYQNARLILDQVGVLNQSENKVSTLSGGMRQRVALARTLIQDKPIILMDEPFSSVDALTRHRLQTLSSQLFKNKTILLVTHDPLEALVMGHQILLFPNQHPVGGLCALQKIQTLEVPASLPPRAIGHELSIYHGKLMQVFQAQL